MKKKQPLVVGLVVVATLLIFLFLTIVKPSIDENDLIREFIGKVMTTMQKKDTPTLKGGYSPAEVPIYYILQLSKSNLLGWKIKHIDSQPYPMETGDRRVTVDLVLFYKLQADMLQPKGQFQEGDYPPYGKCTRYPVACHLYFERSQGRFVIDGPDISARKDLLVPMPSKEVLDKEYFGIEEHNPNLMH